MSALTAQACCVLSAAVCVRLCCREEGMAGLWKGLGPNIARNAIINAAELASYDQIKVSLLATGVWGLSPLTVCAGGTGILLADCSTGLGCAGV